MSDEDYLAAFHLDFGDIIGLPGGGILKVHSPERCHGQTCTIHNPSQHHMLSWPQDWSASRRIMVRICPHGEAHPDPDTVDFMERTTFSTTSIPRLLHPCDGCCIAGDVEPTDEQWSLKRQIGEMQQEIARLRSWVMLLKTMIEKEKEV